MKKDKYGWKNSNGLSMLDTEYEGRYIELLIDYASKLPNKYENARNYQCCLKATEFIGRNERGVICRKSHFIATGKREELKKNYYELLAEYFNNQEKSEDGK